MRLEGLEEMSKRQTLSFGAHAGALGLSVYAHCMFLSVPDFFFTCNFTFFISFCPDRNLLKK